MASNEPGRRSSNGGATLALWAGVVKEGEVLVRCSLDNSGNEAQSPATFSLSDAYWEAVMLLDRLPEQFFPPLQEARGHHLLLPRDRA